MMPREAVVDNRTALVNRGLALNYLTIAYNLLEAVVSLIAGVMAGSVALVGFGVDSAAMSRTGEAGRGRRVTPAAGRVLLAALVNREHLETVVPEAIEFVGHDPLIMAGSFPGDPAARFNGSAR